MNYWFHFTQIVEVSRSRIHVLGVAKAPMHWYKLHFLSFWDYCNSTCMYTRRFCSVCITELLRQALFMAPPFYILEYKQFDFYRCSTTDVSSEARCVIKSLVDGNTYPYIYPNPRKRITSPNVSCSARCKLLALGLICAQRLWSVVESTYFEHRPILPGLGTIRTSSWFLFFLPFLQTRSTTPGKTSRAAVVSITKWDAILTSWPHYRASLYPWCHRWQCIDSRPDPPASFARYVNKRLAQMTLLEQSTFPGKLVLVQNQLKIQM